MKLVVSLATRGRPERLIETIKRTLQNITLDNTLIFVGVDGDDVPTWQALAHDGECGPTVSAVFPHTIIEKVRRHVYVSIHTREDTIAAKWNRALAVPADCYLAVGDDDPIATPGFDAKILEAAKRFPDGIGMVYGHLANASFSGVVAPTRGLIDKLGYLFPEYFPYWFCDHWTDDIAKIIGRISFADVRTDQSNPGKTQEMREPGWWATWFDAAYLMRRKIARDIICSEDFQETALHKEILCAHHPLIEYRSRWINDQVRGQSRQLEAWSNLSLKDERYQRVKQKAVVMVPHLLDDYGMDREEASKFRAVLTPPTSVVGLRRAFG